MVLQKPSRVKTSILAPVGQVGAQSQAEPPLSNTSREEETLPGECLSALDSSIGIGDSAPATRT